MIPGALSRPFCARRVRRAAHARCCRLSHPCTRRCFSRAANRSFDCRRGVVPDRSFWFLPYRVEVEYALGVCPALFGLRHRTGLSCVMPSGRGPLALGVRRTACPFVVAVSGRIKLRPRLFLLRSPLPMAMIEPLMLWPVPLPHLFDPSLVCGVLYNPVFDRVLWMDIPSLRHMRRGLSTASYIWDAHCHPSSHSFQRVGRVARDACCLFPPGGIPCS